jgi:hypothetical protein
MAVSLKDCLEYTVKWNILSLVEFVEYLGTLDGGKNAGCLGQVMFDMMGMKLMIPGIPYPRKDTGGTVYIKLTMRSRIARSKFVIDRVQMR